MDKTYRGIIIHTIRYTDNHLIARIFLEEDGLKSFMIRSGKTPRSSKMNLLQPLTLVEFECQMKELSSLHNLKNLRIAHPWQAIPFEAGKSAIVLFLDEILSRTIPEDYSNETLYRFLWNALILLDDSFDEKNFHLWCLLEISRHYGFYPQAEDEATAFFDLRQGLFCGTRPLHQDYMDTEEAQVLLNMLDKEWPQVQDMHLHSSLRRMLLAHLVLYMRIHIENLKEIKSLAVLQELVHS